MVQVTGEVIFAGRLPEMRTPGRMKWGAPARLPEVLLTLRAGYDDFTGPRPIVIAPARSATMGLDHFIHDGVADGFAAAPEDSWRIREPLPPRNAR